MQSPSGRGSVAPIFQLRRGSAAQWEGVLTGPDRQIRKLRFATRTHVSVPIELDGLAAALFPLVMRHGGVLRIAGPITGQMVRNLTDLADCWSNWRPERFHAVTIEASEIIDTAPRPIDPTGTFAWSGSLRSTHTVVRHLAGAVPGSVRPTHAVRVTGVRADDPTPSADPVESFPGARALAALDIEPVLVETNAAGAGLIDSEIGVLPIVAAALHLVVGGSGTAFHARSWPLDAQLRYPRPEPVLPDLYSGAHTEIRCDGGTVPLGLVVAAIARYPDLAAALSGCERRSRSLPPCGRCPKCTLTALAFTSQGVPAPRRELRTRFLRVGTLSLVRAEIAADARGIGREWRAPRGILAGLVRYRLHLLNLRVLVRDTLRWFGAMARLRPVWPR